jgi:hypothetical protein
MTPASTPLVGHEPFTLQTFTPISVVFDVTPAPTIALLATVAPTCVPCQCRSAMAVAQLAGHSEPGSLGSAHRGQGHRRDRRAEPLGDLGAGQPPGGTAAVRSGEAGARRTLPPRAATNHYFLL